jgi:CRISPR system Cascade subunit CasD
MKHTLLLRLAGPMQSWGVQSRFTERDTLTEPTKSGVVGLVCAALGRDRTEDISDLAALKMGVRVDREGRVQSDFHTAQNVLRAKANVDKLRQGGSPNKSEIQDTVISRRFYLADAHFTVGLVGDDLSLLRTIQKALRAPHWPLALGRKAFPPGLPPYLEDGLHKDTPLLDALDHAAHPWLAGRTRKNEKPPETLRYILESDAVDLNDRSPVRYTRPDQPVSFAPRRFAQRDVLVTHFPLEPPTE